MTEQAVRERIAELLDGISKPSERVLHLEENVDAVITIVREAMLAPSTVKAAHKGVPPPCQIERVLTNALNEVFGEEP